MGLLDAGLFLSKVILARLCVEVLLHRCVQTTYTMGAINVSSKRYEIRDRATKRVEL